MNILSLFDWMSCWCEALTRAGIKIDNYFASEIDKYAIEISKKNHPDIVHIWSVTDIKFDTWTLYDKFWPVIDRKIDLLIGGSPCQDLSTAKKDGKGLAGEKSTLFFEYVRLLNETKPNYFLLENVASMKKADRDEITRILWVEPVMINSALVSAQNRKRLYWVGKWNGTKYETVEIPQPEDKGILLRDILEDIPYKDPQWKPVDEKYLIDWKIRIPEATKLGYIEPVEWDGVDMAQPKSTTPRGRLMRYKSNALTTGNQFMIIWITQIPRGKNKWWIVQEWEKSPTLSTSDFPNNNKIVATDEKQYIWRKPTPIECERLQTLPDNYTDGVSNSQRYKMIGNGWTVDTVAHIFQHIKNEK